MRVLFSILVLAAHAAADVPPIDAAIKTAAEAKKLLVVEFGATWCGPCRIFEQKVLTDPKVIAELKNVVFVQYDIDTPIGAEAAARYKEDQGVPTFLVIDARGAVTFRIAGMQEDPAWFIQLLRTGRTEISPIQRAREALAKNPDDLDARIALARLLREGGAIEEAASHYRAVAEHDRADRILTAEAAAAIQDIDAAKHRIEAELANATLFVDEHPGSPIASRKLALLVLARRARPSEIRKSIEKHLAEVRPIDLPDAVRVAILAGWPDDARLALRGDLTRAALMLAEIELATGKRSDANRIVDSTCKNPRGIEAWCLELQGALRSAGRVPGVDRLRIHAMSILHDLRSPGVEPSRTELANLAPEIANPIARAVLDAERRCSRFADGIPRILIEIDLATSGGPPRTVELKPPVNTELASCIRYAIFQNKLPAGEHVHAWLYFEHAQRRRDRDLDAPSARVPHGALLAVSMHRGSVEASGVTIDTLVDLHSFATLRLTGSAQLEGGVESESLEHPIHAWRILVGAGVGGARAQVVVNAGVGRSKYGAMVPSAFEIPWEARLRLALTPSYRLHAWVRGAFVLGEATRESDSAVLGADEYSIGLGLAGPVFRQVRGFTSVSYEHRAIGDGFVVVAGFPIGGFF